MAGVGDYMDIRSLLAGIIAIVVGALMLADGVLGAVAGISLIFKGTNPSFAVAVGIIALLLGAHLVEKGEAEEASK